MNRDLLIPRRKPVLSLSKRPARQFWLMSMARHVASCFTSLIQRIGNYCHYRKQGICRSIAWAQARNTL